MPAPSTAIPIVSKCGKRAPMLMSPETAAEPSAFIITIRQLPSCGVQVSVCSPAPTELGTPESLCERGRGGSSARMRGEVRVARVEPVALHMGDVGQVGVDRTLGSDSDEHRTCAVDLYADVAEEISRDEPVVRCPTPIAGRDERVGCRRVQPRGGHQVAAGVSLGLIEHDARSAPSDQPERHQRSEARCNSTDYSSRAPTRGRGLAARRDRRRWVSLGAAVDGRAVPVDRVTVSIPPGSIFTGIDSERRVFGGEHRRNTRACVAPID